MLAQSSIVCETQQRGIKATDLLKGSIGRGEINSPIQMQLIPISEPYESLKMIDRIIYNANCMDHAGVSKDGHISIFSGPFETQYEKHNWVENGKWESAWFRLCES